MPNELYDHLDFWLEGQKQGFAGSLPRIKLPDGSKMVTFYRHPRLYVDRWYGSDLGGGQTLLYVLSEPWNSDNPLQIVGTPVCRLGYSGEIVRRFTEEEMKALEKKFGRISQSDIVWKVLKAALSQVTRGRPFRGPVLYRYPECPDLVYFSKENGSIDRAFGEEGINFRDITRFVGVYDFILIKKNLEDRVVA